MGEHLLWRFFSKVSVKILATIEAAAKDFRANVLKTKATTLQMHCLTVLLFFSQYVLEENVFDFVFVFYLFSLCMFVSMCLLHAKCLDECTVN